VNAAFYEGSSGFGPEALLCIEALRIAQRVVSVKVRPPGVLRGVESRWPRPPAPAASPKRPAPRQKSHGVGGDCGASISRFTGPSAWERICMCAPNTPCWNAPRKLIQAL